MWPHGRHTGGVADRKAGGSKAGLDVSTTTDHGKIPAMDHCLPGKKGFTLGICRAVEPLAERVKHSRYDRWRSRWSQEIPNHLHHVRFNEHYRTSVGLATGIVAEAADDARCRRWDRRGGRGMVVGLKGFHSVTRAIGVSADFSGMEGRAWHDTSPPIAAAGGCSGAFSW